MELTGLKAIRETRYSHDAMIDLIIANPMVSQNDIARHFGYTAAWTSRIFRSDAFREALAKRKNELVDPQVVMRVEQRFEALVDQSLEILQQQLASAPTFDKALKAADLGSRALGYGAKQATVNVNTQFVVHTPEKAKDSKEWLEGHQKPAGD